MMSCKKGNESQVVRRVSENYYENNEEAVSDKILKKEGLDKVYIVTSGCYSDYGIDRVFDSLDKAKNFVLNAWI